MFPIGPHDKLKPLHSPHQFPTIRKRWLPAEGPKRANSRRFTERRSRLELARERTLALSVLVAIKRG